MCPLQVVARSIMEFQTPTGWERVLAPSGRSNTSPLWSFGVKIKQKTTKGWVFKFCCLASKTCRERTARGRWIGITQTANSNAMIHVRTEHGGEFVASPPLINYYWQMAVLLSWRHSSTLARSRRISCCVGPSLFVVKKFTKKVPVLGMVQQVFPATSTQPTLHIVQIIDTLLKTWSWEHIYSSCSTVKVR